MRHLPPHPNPLPVREGGLQQSVKAKITYAGRWLILLLLGIALWNPALPGLEKRPDLILLYDDSLSMKQSTGDEHWKKIAQNLAARQDYERLAVIRFASGAVVEHPLQQRDTDDTATLLSRPTPPRVKSLDDSASDIKAAIETALAYTAKHNRPRIFLIISDGWQTEDDATALLSRARSQGVRVYIDTPDRYQTDSWISQLTLPTQARTGDLIPITVGVHGNHTGQTRLQLLLNGQLQHEQAIDIEKNKAQRFRYNLPLLQTGALTLTARLSRPEDSLRENNQRSAIINVSGPIKSLYVSNDHTPAPLLQSLQNSQRPILAIKPAHFPDQQTLDNFGVIILDNIATDDMTGTAWKRLEKAVTTQGVGLMVLGGPRTFGGGGYRFSTLEDLLPLTAEAGTPQPRAALLFLVDKSGSMGTSLESANRLAIAKRAILDTAMPLIKEDLVGLIAFDNEAHELLPLENNREPHQALAKRLTIAASGGTQLKPALALAIDRLAQAPVAQRLLLLVSDGYVKDEGLSEFTPAILENKIDIIALAVGHEIDARQLEPLTALNNGKLIRVTQSASLPRIIRHEVENWRNPVELSITQPHALTRLPFAPDIHSWPPLAGYMVTKEKEDATLHLQSAQGDPVLATWQAGAGRVAALPGGLGAWASQWHTWEHWGEFTGGLIQWLARNHSNPHLYITTETSGNKLILGIDATTADSGWRRDAKTAITLSAPDGTLQTVTPDEIAPGHYQSTLQTRQSGRYMATIDIDGESLHYATYSNAAQELTPPAEPPLARWKEDGLISEWQPGNVLENTEGSNNYIAARQLFLPIILALFISLLFYEYGVPTRRLSENDSHRD